MRRGVKPFIDKKASSTFQLVCRTTEDGEEVAGGLEQERDFALVSGPPIYANGERQRDSEGDGQSDSQSQYTPSQYSRSGRLTRARRAELLQVQHCVHALGGG